MKDKKMLSEIYCLNKEMNRNISRIANFVVMIFMWIAKNDFDKKGDEKGKKLAGFGLMVMAIANILLMIEDGIDMVRELIGKDELECEDDEFKEILDIHRLSEKDILDRYDAVFHMQSTSVGNAEFYDKSTNQYRFSSPEQARIQEHKTIETWSKHANFHFIPVEKDFKTKIQKLKALVFKELENKI